MEPTLPNPNATAAPNPESSISDGGGLPAEQLIAEKHELPQTPPPLAATSTVADDPALQVPSASDATDIAAVSDNSQASLPAQADDADVIEKEWVDKAKKNSARNQG